MSTIARRQFLTGAALAGAGAFMMPAVGRSEAKPYAGQTLTVFAYIGKNEEMLRKHLVGPFQERTGAQVLIDTGYWEMLPKLKASPPGQPAYDAVMTDPTQGLPAIKEGLFEKINMQNVPNARMLPPRMQEDWYQANGWGVNFAGAPMVMAFNTEVVPRPPQRWHDLLNPEYRGKISMYNASYQSIFAFAQMKAGNEGRPGKGYEELKTNLDGVLKFAAEHRDIVRVWWTNPGDFLNKLLQREIVGGVVHIHGPLAAEAGGKPVKVVSPDEGTAIVQVFWSIPKGTKVKRLAEEFINDFFSTEFQVKRGVDGLQATAHLTAMEQAGRESALYAKFLPTSLEAWNRLRYYPYDIYFEGNNWAKINDFWDREVLRKKRG